MIIIDLTPDELYSASAVGVHRRIVSIFGRNKQQHYQCPNNTEWSTEIEAYAAELAVAKYLNVYWNGGAWNGKVAQSDVGKLQVRHTHHENGSLILYPEDDDEQTFVLVVGRSPKFRLAGYILGKDGKGLVDIKTDCRYPAHWVPQDLLTQFADQT